MRVALCLSPVDVDRWHAKAGEWGSLRRSRLRRFSGRRFLSLSLLNVAVVFLEALEAVQFNARFCRVFGEHERVPRARAKAQAFRTQDGAPAEVGEAIDENQLVFAQ